MIMTRRFQSFLTFFQQNKPYLSFCRYEEFIALAKLTTITYNICIERFKQKISFEFWSSV